MEIPDVVKRNWIAVVLVIFIALVTAVYDKLVRSN